MSRVGGAASGKTPREEVPGRLKEDRGPCGCSLVNGVKWQEMRKNVEWGQVTEGHVGHGRGQHL